MPAKQDPRIELKSPLFWRDIFCEFLVTCLLLIAHVSVGLKFGTADRSAELAGLCTAFIVYALIEGFGHFSGSHMNPIISWSLALTRDISFFRAFCFTTIQCGGAIAGAAFVYGVTPSSIRGHISPVRVHVLLTSVQGVLVEMLITFILVTVTLGVTDRKHRTQPPVALPVGCAVGLNIMMLGQWTGAAMNPALVFGPAVITGIWDRHWVYWAGPYGGATIGVLVYRYFFAFMQTKYSQQKQSKLTEESWNPAADVDINSLQKTNGDAMQLRHRPNNNRDYRPTESWHVPVHYGPASDLWCMGSNPVGSGPGGEQGNSDYAIRSIHDPALL